MLAPLMVSSYPKYICTYFPNRLELSFRTVLLFPKASRIGLQDKIFYYTECYDLIWVLYKWLKEVKIFIQYLVD